MSDKSLYARYLKEIEKSGAKNRYDSLIEALDQSKYENSPEYINPRMLRPDEDTPFSDSIITDRIIYDTLQGVDNAYYDRPENAPYKREGSEPLRILRHEPEESGIARTCKGLKYYYRRPPQSRITKIMEDPSLMEDRLRAKREKLSRERDEENMRMLAAKYGPMFPEED